VLSRSGAQIIAGPLLNPLGRNLLVRHPDGSVSEYVNRGGSAHQ
jgi:hypothetical protein